MAASSSPGFDWLQAHVPESFRARLRQRAAEARQQAVREQAALLFRLGRSRAEVIRRCRQNLGWEHERTGTPDVARDVERLVDEVAGRTLGLDPGR
jgi:hypothetical protein